MTRSKFHFAQASTSFRIERRLSLGITVLMLILTASLPACAEHTDSTSAASQPDKDLAVSTKVANTAPSESLLLQGYNYTDHYIDSFSVNGQGGGNIFESGPESGGGKSACCVSWQPGSKLPVNIKVRWVSGYCMYTETNQYGRSRERRRSIWKEQDALITEAVSEKPRALEIHFYRDGRIEAAVTQGHSPPRLKLPLDQNENRLGVSQEFPRCSDETK